MPRKARLDAAGTLHHGIVRGIERRDIVNDSTDRAYLRELVRYIHLNPLGIRDVID